jgi:PD-(D/E)XK nuclease superfamily
MSQTTYLDRGRANLEALYDEITGQTYGELYLEYDFRTAGGGTFLSVPQISVILSETKDPGKENMDSSYRQNDGNHRNQAAIQLTGKIDRIERLSDDSLIITDYKTG